MANAKNNTYNLIYKKIIDKLSFIITNEITINLLKSDNDFLYIFKKLLSIALSLEKKYKFNNVDSITLINGYKSIRKEEFIAIKDIKYNDIDDIEDDINYIDVYLKNVLGESVFSSLIFKKEVDDKKEEIIDTKIVDGEEVHNFSSKQNQSHQFNAEDYLRNNNVTPEAVAEQLIQKQAEFLVRKDIIENKVFKYDSKPKIVVWLKMINLITFFGFAIMCFAYLILTLVSPGYISSVGGNYKPIISGGADIFNIIAIVILTIYAAFKLYSEIKYFKNDNFKYNIKLTHMLFTLLIFIFFLITFINFLKGYSDAANFKNTIFEWNNKKWNIVDAINDNTHQNTIKGFNFVQPIFAVIITIISFFSLTLIISFILLFIKPRVDVKRLQELLMKYVDDIKNGRIDPSMLNDGKTSNPFGSMFF